MSQQVITQVGAFTDDTASKINSNFTELYAGRPGAAGLLASSDQTLADASGVASGSLTNAPVAGNPTKWLEVNDNGVIRRLPAW